MSFDSGSSSYSGSNYAPPGYAGQPNSYSGSGSNYAPPRYAGQPNVVRPANDPGSGQALAGMILGIVGLPFFFFGFVPLLGLIFSLIGMSSVTRKGMAVAGLVLSLIGLVFAIWLL